MKLIMDDKILNSQLSLPSWERGLKSLARRIRQSALAVAPFAGAWIEIERYFRSIPFEIVAPFAGAWIEINENLVTGYEVSVAPFAGAWIEIAILNMDFLLSAVAPFAGAWIEIAVMSARKDISGSRSLHGSVD